MPRAVEPDLRARPAGAASVAIGVRAEGPKSGPAECPVGRAGPAGAQAVGERQP
jgi:hypothetical protein